VYLTKREKEIIGLWNQGYTNAEIAGKLFLSVSTVNNHTINIFRKLDARNKVHATVKALKNGWISLVFVMAVSAPANDMFRRPTARVSARSTLIRYQQNV
jgi:DNA-binding CsgD family transcriptional regulator